MALIVARPSSAQTACGQFATGLFHHRGMNGSVSAVTSFDDGSGSKLYAGGLFSIVESVFANNIARWNGNSWRSMGTGMNGTVRYAFRGSDSRVRWVQKQDLFTLLVKPRVATGEVQGLEEAKGAGVRAAQRHTLRSGNRGRFFPVASVWRRPS